MKKQTKDRLITYLTIALISLSLGYGWRMWHEHLQSCSQREQTVTEINNSFISHPSYKPIDLTLQNTIKKNEEEWINRYNK